MSLYFGILGNKRTLSPKIWCIKSKKNGSSYGPNCGSTTASEHLQNCSSCGGFPGLQSFVSINSGPQTEPWWMANDCSCSVMHMGGSEGWPSCTDKHASVAKVAKPVLLERCHNTQWVTSCCIGAAADRWCCPPWALFTTTLSRIMSPGWLVQEWFEEHNQEFEVFTWPPYFSHLKTNQASLGCSGHDPWRN